VRKWKAIKVAYLTRKLSLTPEEAQVFWPVYNEFQSDIESLRKSRHDYAIENWRRIDQMSEAEMDEFTTKIFDFEAQENNLKRNYYTEFRKVLPAIKVVRYFKAEEDFKLWIIQQARARKQQQGGGNNRMPH